MKKQSMSSFLTRISVTSAGREISLPVQTAPADVPLAKSPHHWAVLLAGGDGTRLQRLTNRIAGDSRPKQFCRIFGGKSLLDQARERLRPLFREDRTMFVVTSAHEEFYRENLFDVDFPRLIVQPVNRGTGVAIAMALFRILQSDPDAIMAFFPSDHYYSDHAAFASTVESAIRFAEIHPDSLILLGAEPRYPEVEYGWIEPGSSVLTASRPSLMRVSRFWEKPPIEKARELLSAGCLWNTFVGVGSAKAFLPLFCSTVPATVAKIVHALSCDDLEGIYANLNTVDFSRDVLRSEPHRLLVLPDAGSGWTDFGSPRRVIDTLVQNQIEPEWLREMNVSDSQVAR